MKKSRLYRKLIKEEELTTEEASTLGDITTTSPELPFKYIIRGDKHLGSKIYSKAKTIAPICSSKNNLIAKCEGRHSLSALTLEAQKHQFFYNTTTSIPKPLGLFNIYDTSKRKFTRAFVMEKIDGQTMLELREKSNNNFKRVAKLYIREKEKIEKKKIKILDAHDENIIFAPMSQKIYLIDVESWWEQPTPSQHPQ